MCVCCVRVRACVRLGENFFPVCQARDCVCHEDSVCDGAVCVCVCVCVYACGIERFFECVSHARD